MLWHKLGGRGVLQELALVAEWGMWMSLGSGAHLPMGWGWHGQPEMGLHLLVIKAQGWAFPAFTCWGWKAVRM